MKLRLSQAPAEEKVAQPEAQKAPKEVPKPAADLATNKQDSRKGKATPKDQRARSLQPVLTRPQQSQQANAGKPDLEKQEPTPSSPLSPKTPISPSKTPLMKPKEAGAKPAPSS